MTSRHIPWETLSARIDSGIPFVHRIPAPVDNVPAIDIRVSENGEELALWLPCPSQGAIAVSPLAAIAIELVSTPAGQVLAIHTRSSILFQELYGFFVSVVDKVQLKQTNPFAAVEETLDAWRELLRARALLSEEGQLGLRGELYFLRELIGRLGPISLTAWVGPQRQPHDFRIGTSEFEVKTTRGNNHIHVINGLRQLEPSPGHVLYVFSLRLAPAGAKAGTTLPEDIVLSRTQLALHDRSMFDKVLRTRYGYLPEDADWYPDRLQLAAKPYLVPVNYSCPRITAELLAASPHAARLSDVRYRANFEGLGYEEGTSQYQAMLIKALASAT